MDNGVEMAPSECKGAITVCGTGTPASTIAIARITATSAGLSMPRSFAPNDVAGCSSAKVCRFERGLVIHTP